MSKMNTYRVGGAAVVIALLSAVSMNQTAAAGSILFSKHDLSSNSINTLKASSETETCKFCHLPHGALSGQPLLWSHQASATTGYGGWGSTTTNRGTTLPTTNGITAASARCFACHDGTVAVGAINSFGTPTTIAVMGTGHISGINRINPSSMAGNHPVSIPYPGSTYNGITSAASAAAYAAVTTAGCTSGSGKCTSSGSAGPAISILGTAGGYGIECTSCHSPHDPSNGNFLVTSNASSALCLGCHNI